MACLPSSPRLFSHSDLVFAFCFAFDLRLKRVFDLRSSAKTCPGVPWICGRCLCFAVAFSLL